MTTLSTRILLVEDEACIADPLRALLAREGYAVQHVESVAKARDELGYEPKYSYAQSIAAFDAWYKTIHALDGPAAALLRQLY